MTMKSRQAISLITGVAVAGFVATAIAQSQSRPRGADSADGFPASTSPRGISRHGQSSLYSGTTDDPRVTRLAADESTTAHQVDDLTRQLEAADNDSQRDEIKKKLSDVLAKQFDLRQQRHGVEIEALEAQVKKLKELVQKRQQNREEIIARRLDQLVRNSQGLGF
jgi:hypothetical protein